MHSPENERRMPTENIQLAEKIKRIMHHMKYAEGSTAYAGCTKMLRALDMNSELVYNKRDPEQWLSELESRGVISTREYDVCLDIITSEIHFEKPSTETREDEYTAEDDVVWNSAWDEAVRGFVATYPTHRKVVDTITEMCQKSRCGRNQYVDDFIAPYVRAGVISRTDENKYIDVLATIQEKAQIEYEKKRQNSDI